MAALIVDMPQKWIDNLLCHSQVHGVSRGKQGVERAISEVGLLAIEIARLLNAELSIPLARAIALANHALVMRNGAAIEILTTSGVRIELPPGIHLRLAGRSVDAAESIAVVRRGRPPRSTRTSK